MNVLFEFLICLISCLLVMFFIGKLYNQKFNISNLAGLIISSIIVVSFNPVLYVLLGTSIILLHLIWDWARKTAIDNAENMGSTPKEMEKAIEKELPTLFDGLKKRLYPKPLNLIDGPNYDEDMSKFVLPEQKKTKKDF